MKLRGLQAWRLGPERYCRRFLQAGKCIRCRQHKAPERSPADHRILRVSGKARIRTDRKAIHAYRLHILFKVLLLPGNIINWISHPRQLWLRRYYTAQSAQKGQTSVIEVIPETIEVTTEP